MTRWVRGGGPQDRGESVGHLKQGPTNTDNAEQSKSSKTKNDATKAGEAKRTERPKLVKAKVSNVAQLKYAAFRRSHSW